MNTHGVPILECNDVPNKVEGDVYTQHPRSTVRVANGDMMDTKESSRKLSVSISRAG